MKSKNPAPALLLSAALLCLILDSKTAIEGMTQGISLCLRVVIPSLFPMMMITSALVPFLLEHNFSVPYKIRKKLNLKKGDEAFFLTGSLGGYPVGAACIFEAYDQGTLDRKDAQRLLRFCNNAGPAFIFGMGAVLFHRPLPGILSWSIQIISAILACAVTPIQSHAAPARPVKPKRSDIVSIIKKLAIVCSWIALFRVLICFLQKWFLWLLPVWLQVLLTGVLELSNGICDLASIVDPAIRFVLFNTLLSLGGVCVHMQTASVCPGLSMWDHFIGKLQQTIFVIFLALISLPLLFHTSQILIVPMLVLLALIIFFSKNYSNLRKVHI